MSVVGLLKALIRDEMRATQHGELGVVTSIYPHQSDNDQDNYECSVKLKDTGQELRHVPVATGVMGGVAIPSVADLVLVNFVQGDLNQPVITGRLYNDKQRPPVSQANEMLYHLPPDAGDSDALVIAIRSGQGFSPTRQIEITMGDKLSIKLTDDDPVAEIKTNSLTIQLKNSGDVSIDSQGKVEIKSSAGLELKSDGNINIEASGQMTIKGATIDLN
jgi:hypothetical protein